MKPVKRHLYPVVAALAGLGLSFSGGLAAGGNAFQSIESIRLQAEAFVAAHPYQSPYPVSYRLGRLDPRLKLKACADALAIDFARADRTMGNTALLVRCPAPPGWKIHLPARIDLYDDIIVAAKPLVRGQILDASAIEFRKTNVTRLNNGYFQKDQPLRELEARRHIARGAVLTPANLGPRMLVVAGQRVTLVLEFNGLRIKTTGKALRSASLGQPVRVENSQTRRIVEGVVAGAATVRVGI